MEEIQEIQEIQEIYDRLNWKNTDETQTEGIRLARKLSDLSLLIMPPAPPSVWEHCAQVLSEKSDLALEPYLNKILEWVQDANWPGALVILNRLKIFSGKKLKTAFLQSFTRAIELSSTEGFKWLDCLSELLDNEQLKMELPQEVIEKLQVHYHNWGWWCDDVNSNTGDGSVCFCNTGDGSVCCDEDWPPDPQ